MLIIGSLNVCLKTRTMCSDHAVRRALSVCIYKSVAGLLFVHVNGKSSETLTQQLNHSSQVLGKLSFLIFASLELKQYWHVV